MRLSTRKKKVTAYLTTSSRGLTAGAKDLPTLLDPVVEPRGVEIIRGAEQLHKKSCSQRTFPASAGTYERSIPLPIHRSNPVGLGRFWIIKAVFTMFLSMGYVNAHSSPPPTNEPIEACIVARDTDLTPAIRAQFAQCLAWQANDSNKICGGSYQSITPSLLANPEEVRITADQVSLYRNKPSTLRGHVAVQQGEKIVSAQTAYIYRDAKSNKITKIEFLGAVHYREQDKLMIARQATINPEDNSGETFGVLYRFNTNRSRAALPAWGRASLIKQFANKNYLLEQATYTTCAPQDKAWDIQAQSITLDKAKATGVAKHARIRIREWPILYLPYLSFSTSKERKSGFLTPILGYSNVGGVDYGVPFYWNMAPNYDMTITPHAYTERGVMLGSELRYMSSNSNGIITGDFLPSDKAYKNFLLNNQDEFPKLRGNSSDRWYLGAEETMTIAPNLQFNATIQQVSDDYYLQDFSSNWSLITQRQLLRQADLTYSTDHWTFRGMGQSYQTLHPINEPPISSVYERLPQLMANGWYDNLPFNANLSILGQYDQFHWPEDLWNNISMPQGPRLHFNPILSLPNIRPWGYISPAVQVVESNYEVKNSWGIPDDGFNRFIPRYSVDSGLYFERNDQWQGRGYTQTLEPRLFYLQVPYQDQTPIPVYDSGYMIFNVNQLFRTNRFSGFDRIGDANQLAYAMTSRWLDEQSGLERANFTMGQIKYFADRKVTLCQSATGYCPDNPYAIGYLSPTFGFSPVASRLSYHLNSLWELSSDYIWDPATRATNNADLNLHYQPANNSVISGGYSYLIHADNTQVRDNATQNDALHQAILAFTWPLNEKWSSVGAYSHNLSKNYSMMSLLGVQYDSCCWSMRILGGRTFKNLNASFEPQYNNNVYVQLLLKGLGSIANNDPNNILSTFIPGYNDPFHY